MSMNGPGETTTQTSRRRPDGGLIGLLRAAALIALVAGAVGSEGMMLRAGQRTPRFLLVLFIGWVFSPFLALAWAMLFSKRWSVFARATLHCVTIVIALGSLAIYGGLVHVAPRGSAPAAIWVAVPPASLVLMAIVVPTAALLSRRLSQRAGA